MALDDDDLDDNVNELDPDEAQVDADPQTETENFEDFNDEDFDDEFDDDFEEEEDDFDYGEQSLEGDASTDSSTDDVEFDED